jgi:hypothetical protein
MSPLMSLICFTIVLLVWPEIKLCGFGTGFICEVRKLLVTEGDFSRFGSELQIPIFYCVK